ncbi:MAG TPA: non-canonical purine NTP pyrophosphatase, partial [Flavobacteriaceae bacterium]|nr:non-canonical purine NTP pyrophosphatase [Flavobacteriaceae bacterium]
AGQQKNDEDNIRLLLKKMNGITNRKARFVTVIALCVGNDTMLFEGQCDGEITDEKQGNVGFGYDPIFKPKGYDITFAEMSVDLKNKIGHRGKAVRKLLNHLYS